MTLEGRRFQQDSRISNAANSVASEETIQELMDGAEVVLAARQKKRRDKSARRSAKLTEKQEQQLRESGIDPRTLGQGETDFATDEITAAYGQDQSDFQESRSDDKDFRTGSGDTNEIAFFNEATQEYDTIRIPDGVPTERFLSDLDPEQYSAQTVQNIRRSANNVGKSGTEGNVDSARYRPAGKTDVPIRIPSGRRVEGDRRRQIVDTSESRGRETAGRDTGSGITAGNDAAALIRAKVAAGELGLDQVVPQTSAGGRERTIRELLASMDQSAGGRAARDADRAQGRATVEANRPTDLRQLLRIEENNRLRGMTDDYLERRQRRAQGVLDGLPTLIPGQYAYVRDEGSDDARAMTLQDGTFLVDGGNTANVTGMQRVKLNDYRTVNPDDPSTWQASEMPEAARVVGYDGIRYVGADGADLGDSTVPYNPNTPDTAQGLNVGEAPNTVQDLAALEIKKRQGAERMRQVGINPSLDRVQQAFSSVPGMSGAGAPRTLAELQNMVDYTVSRGGTFYSYDPASPGRSKKTTTPTARDVLINKVGLSPDEVGNAMQALVMSDAARDTQMPVDAGSMARANHASKEGFYTGANRGAVPGANPGANNVAGAIRTIPDVKPVFGIDPYADPALLGRNALHHIGTMDSKDRVQTGTNAKGEPIRTEVGPQLRKLTGSTMEGLDDSQRSELLEMARSNQQGAFAEEGPAPVTQGPIERRSREQVILDAQKQYEGYGRPDDTEGILKSANRGVQMEAQIRQTDAQIQSGQAARAEDSSRVDQALRAEKFKREEQVARGNDVSAARDRGERAQLGGQPTRAYQDINTREPLRIPSVPGDSPTRPNVQPIQQAPVQASIAPDPWASTGNQAAPKLDAGGNIGGAAAPNASPQGASIEGPSQGPTRPLTDDLKQELKNLRAGTGGYLTRPDTEITGLEKRRRRAVAERGRIGARGRQIATGGGIGLGALAAGLGLRGIDRVEDQQEAV